MCGIVGIFAPNVGLKLELQQTIQAMSSTIRHRGPDDAGVWIDDNQAIGLGHQRLSILDLSPAGHQPMTDSSGRYVMVFNGEIYNHLMLRAELQALGAAPLWRGHSDTETLLASFAVWGIRATLARAVGMFAIALWDRDERCLTLARDRMGEKPLFYGLVRGSLLFASELKAFHAYPGFDNPVNRDVLALYLSSCAVPAPYSIYDNIFKLEAGCFLSITASDISQSSFYSEAYWNMSDVAKQGLLSPLTDEEDTLQLLDKTLRDAVALQAVADVPLGAFLSGGVDSSMIVALMQAQSMQPVNTFTVGFDEAGFDESMHAKAVAKHLNTHHHELRVSALDAQKIIPDLPAIYDEPFADSSQIPTYFVCQAARAKVTVALSGDAGDELFGGYNRYILGPRLWQHLSKVPHAFRHALGAGIAQLSPACWDRIAGLLPRSYAVANFGHKMHKMSHRLKDVRNIDELYRSLVLDWPQALDVVIGAKKVPTLLDNAMLDSGISDAAHRMMLWDSLNYLPDDILTKVDRAAMRVSLETRVPFLDHRVVELAWRMPLHMKIRNGQGKWALRQVLYQYVPRELIERPKMGFGVPIGAWLRGPLRDWAEHLLSEARSRQEGYLNPDAIHRLWTQHLSGRYDWTTRLWSVLMFQAWLEMNS